MADTYSWADSATGGAWQTAPDWTDATTNAPAATPPNSANAATVTGGGGTNFQILTGPGSAASLQFYGNTALEGSFGAGTLTIGSTVSSLDAGAVDLENNSTLGDSGPAIMIGNFEADGTNALFTSPLLTEASGGSFYVLDGATLRASAGTIGGVFFFDPLGIAEIGTAGGARAGTLTVDSGATLTLAGGAIINDPGVHNLPPSRRPAPRRRRWRSPAR